MPLKPEILARRTAVKTRDLWGLAVPVFEHGVPARLVAELGRLAAEPLDSSQGVEAVMRVLAAILHYSPVPEDRLTFEELMELPLTLDEVREASEVIREAIQGVQEQAPSGEEGNSPTPATLS